MVQSVFNREEKRRDWRLKFRRNPSPIINEFIKAKGEAYGAELGSLLVMKRSTGTAWSIFQTGTSRNSFGG